MLDNKLIKEFVEITQQNETNNTKNEILYGTVRKSGENHYIQLDGSDVLMPFEDSIDVTDKDRVCVKIVNNRAYIDTNTSVPTTGYNYVYDDGDNLIKTDDPEASANATQSAMNTAIGANTNAQSAISKATEADTNAQSAISKATEADTNAQSAISKATEADTNAQSAISKATEADTNAQLAKEKSEEAKQTAQEAQQYAEEHGWSTEIGDNWIKTTDVIAENLIVNNGSFNSSFEVKLDTNIYGIKPGVYEQRIFCDNANSFEIICYDTSLEPNPDKDYVELPLTGVGILDITANQIQIGSYTPYEEPGLPDEVSQPVRHSYICSSIKLDSIFLDIHADNITFHLSGYEPVSLETILSKLKLLTPRN